MSDKIDKKYKINVSSFVANTLYNDAMCFEIINNSKPDVGGLVNKLIPALLYNRKARRNEIENSEVLITAQSVTEYVRGLLNEYARFPQYKRESFAFSEELKKFDTACNTRQILHFKNKLTKESFKAFAFGYFYGHLYNLTNYCVIFDLKNNKIKSIPLHLLESIFTIKQKYKPSEKLIELLQDYCDNYKFNEEIRVKED